MLFGVNYYFSTDIKANSLTAIVPMSDVILGSRCRAMKGTGLNIFFFFVKRSEDGGRNNDFSHQRDTLLVAADVMTLLQLSSVSSPLSIALTPLQLT